MGSSEPGSAEHDLVRRVLRFAAGAGAIFAGWIALDGIRSNPLRDSAAGEVEFLVYWVLPFAAATIFLAWFALRGGRREARRVARQGCLGGASFGGAVFLLYLVSPLVLRWDAISGAVHAFLYAPLAAVVGLLLGLAVGGMKERRP